MRNFETPSRSPAHARGGMVATSHTLSTLAGIEILRAGGNAMDAAIAACAVQCVVEPESTGIGGDNFCLYAPKGSADIVAFNGSGKAPAAATVDWYLAQGITSIQQQSPHSVTVPGAIDAWTQLHRDHGRLDFEQILAPAIGYARDGYPVASRVSYDFALQTEMLSKDEGARAVFMPNGRTPGVGEVHHQPALAVTLEKIARGGREAFYSGEVAEGIVALLNSRGGLHTMDDFANMVGDYVTPISTEYRGHQVHECPPNGQGVIALLLLNIMGGFKTDGVDPIGVERLHQEIEAGRLAYQDRNVFVADPKQADVPVDWLLSMEHADELRSLIDPAKAMDDLPPSSMPPHKSTVYISVVDEDRNACSFINTLFHNFGSVQLEPNSGVMLHNRGQGFVIEPGHPNCIAPNKRPMHTIIPGMITKGDKAVMPFGVMGGHYQSFGHMQMLTKYFDFGMDIQECQDAPRIFPLLSTGEVQIEGTVPADVIEGLRKRGHKPVRPEKALGGSQAIWIDWDTGVLTGGSEPRKDGCAMGY